MWQDQPITGQGFLAYKQLADEYGDPVLGSPHNEWLRLFAEEGTVTGIVGLGFLATSLWWVSRRRDPIAGGLLSGVAGYFLMASFNNPLLFIQISVVAFTALGYGLARAVRSDERTEPAST
jgi:O-antigen ligase